MLTTGQFKSKVRTYLSSCWKCWPQDILNQKWDHICDACGRNAAAETCNNKMFRLTSRSVFKSSWRSVHMLIKSVEAVLSLSMKLLLLFYQIRYSRANNRHSFGFQKRKTTNALKWKAWVNSRWVAKRLSQFFKLCKNQKSEFLDK